jgi:ribosomal protein S18 acetylase RimI-like enzyme
VNDFEIYSSSYNMNYREADPSDIEQMFIVRLAVKENILLSTDLVTSEITKDYLIRRGKGWICEIESKLVGFSIVDLQDNSVWALFVHPEYERMGIGRKLHDLMLDWYFTKTEQTIWLTTDINTRAEKFYRKAGWSEVERIGKSEIKFEMTANQWH